MVALTTLFLLASSQYHLPPGLLNALCYVESKHNPNAIHHDDGGSDSIGLCQIKLKTARWMGYKGTAEGLLNPKVNVHYAAKYLAYQISRYDKINKAVIAYNIGHADKGLTTTKYQLRVFKQWEGR